MSYYDVLGIAKNATDKEIKKAYKRLAIKYHPDKADEHKKEEHTKKFQEITEANEVLSDPEKRKIYDLYGKDGLDETKQRYAQQQSQQHNAHHIFEMFPGMFQQQKRGPRKNQDTLFNLGISLSQSYTGITKKFRVTKDTIVYTYTDTPEPIYRDFENSWHACQGCSGQGVVLEQNRMGNMIQMTQRKCQECDGTGYCMKPGYCIQQIPENITIEIPKGVKTGTQIRVHQKGNCAPGTLPGDIIVIVQVTDNERGFTRKADDLRFTHSILLSEALCGGKVKIITLDDRELFIKFGPINPGDVKVIKGEGMKLPNSCGDLYIDFNIVFPKLNNSQQIEIKKILPDRVYENNESFDDNKIKYVI